MSSKGEKIILQTLVVVYTIFVRPQNDYPFKLKPSYSPEYKSEY
jgi:hypothetical protein